MADLKHIMLVEDEPDIREIATLALQEIGGFKVTVCESGHQALIKLTEIKPELLLLDVMMPDMDGPTTLSKIRTFPNLKDIPIIFMTARVQPQEVTEYLKLGAIGTIPKPFDPTQLASQITQLWDKHSNDKTA